MHNKDIVARSLTKKYSMLRSINAEIPQALWFYPNGRGPGKHSGKIHYHIEYMVKKDRKQVRSKTPAESNDTSPIEGNGSQACDNETLLAMIEKLKYIVPTDASLEVIKDDWMQTFDARKKIRDSKDVATLVDRMIENFPLSIEFDGSLIATDFALMFPNATNFLDTWDSIQSKIAERHHSLHTSMKSQFFRTLMIVKEKNPSRGVKRVVKGAQKITNLLEGVIEWINHEDDVQQFAASYAKTRLPVLVIKGPQYEDTEEAEAYVCLNKRAFAAGTDVRRAFLLLIQTFYFFNLKFEASLSNFYNVFVGGSLEHRQNVYNS
ncbi:uncharacterized protein LOC109407266 [Aedes albopictus]|uniref:Uncharacterized protein n=1 Tax=Aedes albopictus TaxID=7160 RepID=A0ABM2A0J2_AEDAL